MLEFSWQMSRNDLNLMNLRLIASKSIIFGFMISSSPILKNFDMMSIIEAFNGYASKEISKLLKDSDNFTIQLTAQGGSVRQVDIEKLANSLVLHLVAVLLSSNYKLKLTHLLRGVRLLHTLSEVASRHSRLEQILLDDVKASEQLVDLVFFMLIILAQTEQDFGRGTQMSPLHSALVACTLHLLTCYISSQLPELVHVLLAHPKVKALYVKNLPDDVTSEKLKALFDRHGEVTRVVLPPSKPGQSKCDFGFIYYAERSSALKAVKEDEKYEIDGNALMFMWILVDQINYT